MIKYLAVICFTVFVATACSKNTHLTQKDLGFRYHIPVTPLTFDPILQKGTSSWFLLNHLFRPLVSIDAGDQLYFNAAKECVWTSQNLFTCTLKDHLKFQDGTPITSKHFKYSFELAFEQVTETSGFFLNLKNQDPHLDILTPDDKTLQFAFKTYSPQDIYLLAKTEFSPRPQKMFYKKPEELISSGSYKVLSYKKGQHVTLTANTINNEVFNSSPRPNVTVYFIEDEGTAIRMFESQKLDFIKNVPRAFFNKYKEQLHFQTMMRMDGIGLSKAVDNMDLKRALSYSLNFSELQTIYKSKGLPGCPALPSKFYKSSPSSEASEHCYTFDLKKAQAHYDKVPSALKTKAFTLNFSEVGGTDIQKGMEWIAYQWKKHLGLEVRILPLESGQFFQKIRDRNFEIIRKGLPLLTPTCAEALESFTSDSVNNFTEIQNTKLDQIVKQLKILSLDQRQKQQDLCSKGLMELKKTYSFIPLGEMYFAFLSNGRYKNWSINSFNMLNLEELSTHND